MSAIPLEETTKHHVPAAWKCEELPGEIGFVLYTEPRFGGMVTVDTKARGFRLGMSRHGPLNSSGVKYKGRGWLAKLERDATAYLAAAMK